MRDHRQDLIARTGSDGVAKVRVAEGLWNVRTLYAAPSASPGTDWDVFFATLVFRVAGHRD